MEIQNVPKHIAIIMDGNRRWARTKGLPAKMGHREGAKTVREIATFCNEIQIEYLTLFAFSTENWKREKEEVDEIMRLLREFLDECIEKLDKEKFRIAFIGERSILDQDIKEKMRLIEEKTKKNEGLCLVLAINYGGRDEVIRAIRRIQEEKIEDLTEEIFDQYLDTKDIPDPDFVIRTSGEERISNFLIWQIAYSELIFIEKLWPDFDKQDLLDSILAFNMRNRRFGGK